MPTVATVGVAQVAPTQIFSHAGDDPGSQLACLLWSDWKACIPQSAVQFADVWPQFSVPYSFKGATRNTHCNLGIRLCSTIGD